MADAEASTSALKHEDPVEDVQAPFLPFDAQAECWADVQPTFQDDGPGEALCPIMYDPDYSSAMDLFRTMHPQRELSARALALTTHLATLNPSSYSVWAYRADILVDGPETIPGDARTGSLGPKEARLRRELAWMEEMALGNMKSYQVWQHRRLVLSALEQASARNDDDDFGKDLKRELAFISTVLDRDAKNYHTWAYRQWVLAHYGGLGPAGSTDPASSSAAGKRRPWLWNGELAYTQSLLVADARNNSAWNHRFFLLFGSRRAEGGPAAVGLSTASSSSQTPQASTNLQGCIKLEVAFTKAQISTIPNNASAWAYLRGIIAFDAHASQSQAKERSTTLAGYDLPRWVESVLLPPGLLAVEDKGETKRASESESDAASEPAPAPAPTHVPALALEFLLDELEAALEAEAEADAQAEGEAAAKREPEQSQASEEPDPEGSRAQATHRRAQLRSRATRLAALLTREDPVRARWWAHKLQRVEGLLG